MKRTSVTSPVSLRPKHSASRTEPRWGEHGKPVTRVTATSAALTSYSLSLVVPAFNEEKRLPATLERISEYRRTQGLSVELLIVDDGSRDATREVAKAFARDKAWVRVVHYDDDENRPVNRGKGFAVRQGVLASVGREVLFTDADLSYPVEEMEKLLPPITRGEFDVSLASRALPDSDSAHQPWYRELMGRTFNKLVRTVIHTNIRDTQSGFKAFRGDVARRLFALARIDGFGFDPEIIYLAGKFGYRMREVGVVCRHMDESRINPLLSPLAMTRELFEIRLNDLRGVYAEHGQETSRV